MFVDMRGARWTAPGAFDVDETARRYEDWEFPYAFVLGQATAAQYALDAGIEAAQGRAWALAARLRQALGSLPRVRVLDRGATQCAIVTMTVEGRHADAIVSGLKEQGINTVASLREYGIYDFEAKRVESAVRLSPHYYNTEAEVDAAVEAIRALVA